MANKNAAIYVDVEFTPKVEDFLDKVASEFESADFGKYISLEKDFQKQFTKIKGQLKELKEDMASILHGEISQSDNKAILKIANQLDALAKEMEILKTKTGNINVASSFGDSAREAAKLSSEIKGVSSAVSDLQKGMKRNEIPIVDKREVELLDRFNKLLRENDNQDIKITGNLSADLHELEKVSELVTELGTKFDDAFHPDEFSEPVNEDFRVITADLLEKIQILESLNDQIVEKYGQGALEKKSSLGYSYEDMLQEAFDKQDEAIARSKEYQAVLEDRYSNTLVFLRDIAAKQKEINIPLTIDKDKSKDNLYNQTIQLIQETSQRIEAEGLSIPIRVTVLSEYTNRAIKKSLEDIKKQFAEGAGTEKLQERVDKILETINDRVNLELKFDKNKSEEEARGWIKDFKKKLGDDLKITPVIDIPEEAVKSKTEELQKQLDSIAAGLSLDLGKANITLGAEGEKKLKDTLTETSKKANEKKKKSKKSEEESVVDKEEFASALNLLNQLNKASESLDTKFVSTFKNLKVPEKTVENIKQIIALLELLDNADIDGTELDLASQAILKFVAVVQSIDPNMSSKVEFIKSISQGFDITFPPDALEKVRALGQYVTELKTAFGAIDKNLTDKFKGLKGISEIPSFGSKLKTLQNNIETVKTIANSLDGRVINKLVNLQKISDLLNITVPAGTDAKFALLGVGIKSLNEALKEVSGLISSEAFVEVSSSEFDAAVKKLSTVVNNLSSIFKKIESLSVSLSEDYGSDLDSFASYLQALKNAVSVVDDDFVNNITNLEKLFELDKFEVPDGFANLSKALSGLKQAISVLDKKTLNKIGNLSSLKSLIDFKAPKDFLSQIESLSTGIDKLKKALGKLDENFFAELEKLSDKKMYTGIGAFSVLISSLSFKIPENFDAECKNLTSALKKLKKTLEGIDTGFLTKITKFSKTMADFKKTFKAKTVKDVQKIVDSQQVPSGDFAIGEFINLRNAYNKALRGDKLDLYNFENMFETFNRGEEEVPAEVLKYRDALVEVIKTQDQLNSLMSNPRYTEQYKSQLQGLEAKLAEISAIVDELFKDGDKTVSSTDLMSRISDINKEMKEVMNNSSLPENKLANLQKVNALILRAETINKKYSAARNTEAGRRLDEISKELSSGKVFNAEEIKQYDAEIIKLEADIKRAGKDTKSVLDKLGTTISDNAIRFIANLVSFQRILQLFREGWQYALQFDTALTKISYTMNLTDRQLENMGEDIVELSKNLKTSISDMSTIYQIYSNMNTSVKEMSTLAESTAVLSNLTGVDASTAADQIQGVVQQFEDLESVDASHIVDVFDYISANISVDYSKGIQGIASAVQNVGNVADQAGISFEQLSAIIAKTMEQTRQEGSQIANGLKTILVRISKASTMSDEVDNETLSKASAVLHDIGVEVYNVNGEYREFNTIMSELAEKWDDLTDAQQANISFQVAATRQTAVFKAILQNWEESSQLATEAMDAEGNAIENQQKYLDSFAGKLQGVKNELQDFWITFLNTDAVDTALDALQKLLEILNKIQETFGGTSVVGLTLTGILGFKEFAKVYSGGESVLASVFDKVSDGIKRTVAARKASILATKQQIAVEKEEANSSRLNSAANKEQAGSQDKVTQSANQASVAVDKARESDNREKVSSVENSNANKMQGSSFAALGKSLAVGSIATILLTLLSKAYEAIKDEFNRVEEEAKKTKDAITQVTNELESLESNRGKISDLAQKYSELSKHVDRNGKNVSLSTEEYEEYKDVISEIATIFPDLIEKYNDAGLAVINMSNAYKELNEEQSKSLDLYYLQTAQNEDLYKAWKNSSFTNFWETPFNFKGNYSDLSNYQNLLKLKEAIDSENGKEAKDYYNRLSAKRKEYGITTYGDFELSSEGILTDQATLDENLAKKLKENDYDKIESAIKNLELALNQNLVGVKTGLNSWLNLSEYYSNATEELQRYFEYKINNITFEEALNIDNSEAAQKYIDSIITDFEQLPLEVKSIFEKAFALDLSTLDPVSAFNVMSGYMDAIYAYLKEEYADDPEKRRELAELWTQMLGYPAITDSYLEEKEREKIRERLSYNSKYTLEELNDYYEGLSDELKDSFNNFFKDKPTIVFEDPIEAFLESISVEKKTQTWKEYVDANSEFKDAVEKYLKDEKTLGEFLNKIKTGSYTTDDVYTLQFEWGIDTTDASTMISDLTAKMDELEKEILSGNIQDVLNDKYASTEVKNHVAELANELKRANAEAKGLQNTLRQSSDVIPDIQNLKGAFDQLDSIMADVVDKKSFDYSSIVNNDDFKNTFGDLDYYEEFSDIILHNTQDITKCQEAFNELATEYLYTSNALNSLNLEEAEVVANMLKQYGVTNALEVVESALNDVRDYEAKVLDDVAKANEELANKKSEVSLETDKLDSYTWQEIGSFVKEAEAAGYTAQRLASFALQKAAVEGIDFTNETEINYLVSLAQTAGFATTQILSLAKAKAKLSGYETTLSDYQKELEDAKAANREAQGNASGYTYGSSEWAKAQAKYQSTRNQVRSIESKITRITDQISSLSDEIATETDDLMTQLSNYNPVEITPVKLDFGGAEKTKSAIDDAKGDAEDAAEEAEVKYEDVLDKALDYLRKRLDAQQITLSDYLNGALKLIQDFYDQGLIEAEKYYSALADYYNEQLGLYDSIISAINDVIDDEVEGLEDQKKATEDAYNLRIQAIQDEIDALEKANEARQDAIDLQKAEYELARSQYQRTRLIYKNGQMVYSNDPKAIREAREAKATKEYELSIKSLNEEIEVLQDELEKLTEDIDSQIDSLNEYKEEWNSISDAYEKAQNAALAYQYFGDGWKDKILDQNKDILNSYKDMYKGIEQAMRDAAASSAYEAWQNSLIPEIDDSSKNKSSSGGGSGSSNYDVELVKLSKTAGYTLKGLNDLKYGFFETKEVAEMFKESLGSIGEELEVMPIDSTKEEIVDLGKQFSDISVGVSEDMDLMVQKFNDVGEAVPSSYIQELRSAVLDLIDPTGLLSMKLNETIDFFKAAQKAASEFASTTSASVEGVKALAKELNDASDGFDKLSNSANISNLASRKGNTVRATLNYRGTAYGDGSWTAKSHGTNGPSLVGELGPELRVSNGKYDILGKNGAEFANIKPNDIIFNHKQTEALLKNGRIKGRGKAFADGTLIPISDLPTGSVNVYRSLNIIANNIPKVSDSLDTIIKREISVSRMSPEPPSITVNNPMFTCTGVTGEQVLHQIESSFSGLFINAYQQAMK